MIAQEIVSTCSNPSVASAAVSSIGGEFAGWFGRQASNRSLSIGLFAAELVGQFARCDGGRDWDGLCAATRGADMPILSGLRYILEATLKDEDRRDAIAGKDCGLPGRMDQPLARIFLRESCLSRA